MIWSVFDFDIESILIRETNNVRLDEWQKFIESQFVEASEISAEAAAPEVNRASTLATNTPLPAARLAEQSTEQTAHPFETTPASQQTQQFVPPTVREPASSPASEPPPFVQSTNEHLAAPRLASPAQALHTELNAGSHSKNNSVHIHAEPESLHPRRELEKSDDRTPRRRMTQSIAAHPIFAAETMGRTSAAGSQPILSTPTFTGVVEPAISSANRKAQRASGIYPTPESAANVTDQPESRQKNDLQPVPVNDLRHGNTISEFYVEIPAFASYLPVSHAAHTLASQKSADSPVERVVETGPMAEQSVALEPGTLPVIRESILTPQIDIAVKPEPKIERVSALPDIPEPQKAHPQASIPRTVIVIPAGKSGNAGVVSSVSMSPSSKTDSTPSPPENNLEEAQKGRQAEQHEAQKQAPAESRRRLFGVSVPAYSPPSSSVKYVENQDISDGKEVDESLSAIEEQRSDPGAEAIMSAELSPGQTIEDFAVREPVDTGSLRSKTRHARNVTPNARHAFTANAEGEMSAADLWATVPRHVQSLLALERQDQRKETAQSSYKRPFQEKRHELIERLLDPILSLEDAARLLNVCPTTVRRYTNKGILTYYRKETERGSAASLALEKETRQRRFRLSDILAFLEAQQSALTADRLAERNTSVSDSGLCDTDHE